MASITVVNANTDLSGNTLITEENAYTITGLHTFSRSTNAPFAVNSGAAVVANLDADKLDGQQGSHYLDPANLSSAVAVNKGGTGATTLTDGGVLLGSGTSAVTAMAVLTDGQMIVGDGSGDPVAESGATLRTSVGVGTGDSPQFTGIELGHATDTTLTKASSGDVNIEGNIIYRAGGTDVPVADGGTGVGTLTDGGVLLGSGTGAITPMAVLADSEMIVGDGSGDPVAESGATLRTSIGVGTGDSPTFTAVTVGQADITAEGDLRLQDASGGEYVGLDAPATVSSSYTLTLPAAIGSVNQMLTINNTDGTLQWASASSTSAAGSDTQVQYNDGGTNFGGDAGLVYNDSTDLLTSGKLATTDTSATSIDVAGGITAGTGNVAIVNAAGKIPALSSTYLADLSGANLTGISAGPIVGYTATTGNVSNTTTKTAVVTVGQIGANDWDNGDFLSIALAADMFNNSGSTRTQTWEVDVEGNTATHVKNWEAGGSIRKAWWFITLMRADDEIYWGFTNDQYTRSGLNPGDGSNQIITSVNFAAAIDVVIKLTLGTASTDLYFTMNSANAYLTKRTT